MVGGDGEDQGSADHIGQYQPGPDGAEDEEGDLSGGRAEAVVVELVCDWRGELVWVASFWNLLYVYISTNVEVTSKMESLGMRLWERVRTYHIPRCR